MWSDLLGKHWLGYGAALVGIAVATGLLKLSGERFNPTTAALAFLLAARNQAHGLRRRALSVAQCGLSVRAIDCRAGSRTNHSGRGEGSCGFVGATERTVGRRHTLSLHRRSGERHDLGRTPCILGHGA